VSRLQIFLRRLRKKKILKVIWKNKDYDLPVTVTEYVGPYNGEHYFKVIGSSSAIPFSEISFKRE
jgi:hypothetical protein